MNHTAYFYGAFLTLKSFRLLYAFIRKENINEKYLLLHQQV